MSTITKFESSRVLWDVKFIFNSPCMPTSMIRRKFVHKISNLTRKTPINSTTPPRHVHCVCWWKSFNINSIESMENWANFICHWISERPQSYKMCYQDDNMSNRITFTTESQTGVGAKRASFTTKIRAEDEQGSKKNIFRLNYSSQKISSRDDGETSSMKFYCS